jgi:hypothetical protein
MTNDKQQTAVEGLIEQFWNNEGMLTSKKLVQAKEMEKEIIIKTYIDAKMERNLVKKHFAYLIKLERVTEKAEEYYNKNYNNEQR